MSNVKKTHWFRNTLIVLIICAIAGTILAAILFRTEDNRVYASSSIQFSFNGAAEGKAPNGYPFDVNGITSDEVINTALENAGLQGVYTAEQIRENLSITGVYPEKIAEQMTKYVSLLDANAGTQAALTDYHATQYSVTLDNNFDTAIFSDKLKSLLQEILTAYRASFAKKYAASVTLANPIADLPDYDYAQQLEAITESVNQQSRYAKEMEELAPDFQLGGKDFGDIAVKYQNLLGDIDRLNATITLNAVSKDRERLQKRYEMEIRTQNMQLESLTEELKLIEAQVNSYDKDGIIYVSAGGNLREVGNDQTNTYDKLVQKRKEVTDTIAETNAKIALYQARLNDMTGAAAKNQVPTEEGTDAAAVEELSEKELAQLAQTVDTKIAALTAKKNEVAKEFAGMLEGYNSREINESSVSFTGVKYKAPSLLSGAFVMKVVKTAGPICMVGFMVCIVLIIISRRKEEKAKA